MKLISIVSPCYNEVGCIEDFCDQVKSVMASLPGYDYEHVIIDNNSTDGTILALRQLAGQDKKVKVIINARNFGQVRSPFHGLLQAKGDAVIVMSSDLQDPPEMIRAFVKKWEDGYKIVIGTKAKSKENPFVVGIRKIFYHLIKALSETEQIKNFTGFGLYDRTIIDLIRQFDDPYPYFRGLITEIGFERAEIEFTQPKRTKGRTKNNFYTLYDLAMLGFVNHSKFPLRMASFIGFVIAFASLLVGIGYFIYKLIFWNSFQAGMAPIVIGLFFFAAVQLFFIGIIGEYIGAIYTQIKKRPLVVEKERINFD
jgi:glycosyltransferase involved in cell wall biosynthesis